MMQYYLFFVFFFFSSRRRHTRLTCDWSSDVCSSDLHVEQVVGQMREIIHLSLNNILSPPWIIFGRGRRILQRADIANQRKRVTQRSEERRVGKECRSRWAPYQ